MTSERILYNITDEEAEESFFRGVSYMGKFVYASNKHIFAKVKYDVPKEYKGFTVLKDGTKIPVDNTFFTRLSYKADDYVKIKERDTVDFNVLSDLIATVSNFNNRFPDEKIGYISIKGSKFSVMALQKFLSITDELFLFQGGIAFSQKANALISRDSDNLVMVACCDREKTAYSNNINYDDMIAYAGKNSWEVADAVKEEIKQNETLINNESMAKGVKDIERKVKKLKSELEAYQKLTWVK